MGAPSPVCVGWKTTPEWGQMNWFRSFTFWGKEEEKGGEEEEKGGKEEEIGLQGGREPPPPTYPKIHVEVAVTADGAGVSHRLPLALVGRGDRNLDRGVPPPHHSQSLPVPPSSSPNRPCECVGAG